MVIDSKWWWLPKIFTFELLTIESLVQAKGYIEHGFCSYYRGKELAVSDFDKNAWHQTRNLLDLFFPIEWPMRIPKHIMLSISMNEWVNKFVVNYYSQFNLAMYIHLTCCFLAFLAQYHKSSSTSNRPNTVQRTFVVGSCSPLGPGSWLFWSISDLWLWESALCFKRGGKNVLCNLCSTSF